jgi:hypothetical protein
MVSLSADIVCANLNQMGCKSIMKKTLLALAISISAIPAMAQDSIGQLRDTAILSIRHCEGVYQTVDLSNTDGVAKLNSCVKSERDKLRASYTEIVKTLEQPQARESFRLFIIKAITALDMTALTLADETKAAAREHRWVVLRDVLEAWERFELYRM